MGGLISGGRLLGIDGLRFADAGLRSFWASLASGLPEGSTFTRAAGPASYLNGPPVDGETFVTHWASGNADVPRFDYCVPANRPLLLLEPSRTNRLLTSNFDDIDTDDVPDNWDSFGTPGTDFSVIDGGPHGGKQFRIEDTSQADRGCYETGLLLSPITVYTASAWFRRTGTGDATVYGFALNPGASTFSIGAGPYDWALKQGTDGTSGSASIGYVLEVSGDPDGIIYVCLPQIELGTYATSRIPTVGSALTRGAEKYVFPSGTISPVGGRFRIGLWVPRYDHDWGVQNHSIFTINSTNYFMFRGSDDKFVWINNGVARAESAAQTFDKDTVHILDCAYGPWGTRVGIDGVHTFDSTPWSPPVAALSPALGSWHDGTAIEGAWYGNVEVWKEAA